ncbi:hypothetical protein niasHT_013714 [Heterodera trifolii]|uniref:J domain-containing protein n=1 Tax=Heterodera trifolii TaxID=157864 RepID=A0ABD2LC23_9BILA
MGRAQFEYDEVGNTFYYVIVSFFAVILFPLTHFLWPSLPKRTEVLKRGCRCEGDLVKRFRKEQIKPWEKAKCVIKGFVLLILWALFILLAYKVSQLEQTFEEYDPYKILQLDLDADVGEIKKKYRELSKQHHPDKGGDPATFDGIVKAYKALTDEESRENWRLYGNPDGPKATTFGIALPKWIVSEQYGGWVLGLYVFIFLVILPVAVGVWWYNSIKYSADKVLLETTRLYIYFLNKTPSMEIARIIMVLAGSFEFWKKYNTEVVERETDNMEVPRVMRELRNLHENKKEYPFCNYWSIKARTLIHAYLTREPLHSPRLETDQAYIVGRSLQLVEEMLRVLIQMIQMPISPRQPSIDTLENVLRVFPMTVQALWPRNSALLQLPHVREQNIAYLRKNRVITCQDLAQLNEFRRRALLNTITSDQYEDIIYVLGMMPRLEFDTRIEVQGEDDKETVTVGSVVTLKVTLRRFPLLDADRRKQEIAEGPKSAADSKALGMDNGAFLRKTTAAAAAAAAAEKERNAEEAARDAEDQQNSGKRKVWEKQPKKKAKKGGKPKKRHPAGAPATTPNATADPSQQQQSQEGNAAPSPPDTPRRKPTKAAGSSATTTTTAADENNTDTSGGESPDEDNADEGDDDAGTDGEQQQQQEEGTAGEQQQQQDAEADNGSSFDMDTDGARQWDENEDDDMDDDELIRKQDMLLDTEPVNHHEVHCPYFPGDKFEWWYLYLLERKTRRLVTMVQPCKTLDQEKTVELRFSAPAQKGNYFFTLHIRSDSYMDMDYSVDVKMEVHPAREPPPVKYEDTEDEAQVDKDDEPVSTDDYTEGTDSETED